jgi:Glycosyl transferases group 1
MQNPKPAKRQVFDGIICIGGEDWWYHNRGHFDFQIMRRIAKQWPVLFVNSLGVRMPSVADTSQFASRIGRKLRSFAQGMTHVENGFWVFSPVSVPGEMGRKLSDFALAPQIQVAAARAGITRPLLWMHCPAGAGLIQQLKPVATVMQRTDRFEAFPEGDPVLLSKQIAQIKQAADLVVYAAPHLMAEEQGAVRRQLLVTHGVDVADFIRAGSTRAPGPSDVAILSKPRVGFVGGIDSHTFDPALFLGVVRRLPQVNFVMIGGCSLPEGWCPYPNVKFVGRKPYDMVPRYMAAMDALIMPWNQSDWIKACNPIKLKEYLAVGRPVVTRDFPALDGWRDLVRVAATEEDFASAIQAALNTPYNPEPARARVAGESWDVKGDLVLRTFLDLGLDFVAAPQRAGWLDALSVLRNSTSQGAVN